MKKETHIKRLQQAGHDLILNKDGSVDIWQLEVDYHNGPRCKKCRKSWCHHCEDEIKPCTGEK